MIFISKYTSPASHILKDSWRTNSDCPPLAIRYNTYRSGAGKNWAGMESQFGSATCGVTCDCFFFRWWRLARATSFSFCDEVQADSQEIAIFRSDMNVLGCTVLQAACDVKTMRMLETITWGRRAGADACNAVD